MPTSPTWSEVKTSVNSDIALAAPTLIAHVETAIERARALDKNPADRWPQTLGTRVYLLAESVMNRY